MKVNLEKPKAKEIAFLRLVKSFLDSFFKTHQVPVGVYDVSNYQGTISTSDPAAVTRAGGDKGDGTNKGEAPKLAITPNAVLLLLKGAKVEATPDMWAQCLRDDLKGDAAAAPDNALVALEIVQAEHDKVSPTKAEPKATSATCTGAKELTIDIKKSAVDGKYAKGKKSAA
jgi:hypothetical protein